MFERILVPTEMNDFGQLALRYALLFNERLGSKLTLMYAEEISWLADEHPLGYHFENVREAKEAIELRLQEFANRNTPERARVTTLFADDTAAHAIASTSRELCADLIIMGTHGRHGWSRVLMGSVAERVLRESAVPLMTVRPDLVKVISDVAIRTVLCPVNFTGAARLALEEAIAISEAFDADLIVEHVCEPGDVTAQWRTEDEFGVWIDPLIRDRTRYERIFVRGDSAARVLEVADRLHDGLLVIGAQHKRFSDATTIGTTTERITRFSKVPVVTVVQKAAAVAMAAVA